MTTPVAAAFCGLALIVSLSACSSRDAADPTDSASPADITALQQTARSIVPAALAASAQAGEDIAVTSSEDGSAVDFSIASGDGDLTKVGELALAIADMDVVFGGWVKAGQVCISVDQVVPIDAPARDTLKLTGADGELLVGACDPFFTP